MIYAIEMGKNPKVVKEFKDEEVFKAVNFAHRFNKKHIGLFPKTKLIPIKFTYPKRRIVIFDGTGRQLSHS